MKLLFCRSCQDVFKLQSDTRSCVCGKSYGRYLNDLDAVYAGDRAVPLGFENSSFARAIGRAMHSADLGERFEAFVIPPNSSTFKKV